MIGRSRLINRMPVKANRVRGYSEWHMVDSCRLLAFGIAAWLALAGLCQEAKASSFALQSQSNMPGLFYILIGAAVLLAQSALIILLLLQMRRRQRSEESVRRLTRRLIHASEEEHRHLARELHDDIGQRLSLISVGLGSLSRMRAITGQDGVQEVEQSLEELHTLISDVHGLSHRMHSSKLELLGLQGALRELCQQIAKRHNLQLDLQMDEIGCDLDAEVSLSFYRVAQEALSNVVRHSSSSRAAVRLIVSRGVLGLQVEDEGTGFETSKTPAGLGMTTMEERLRSVGGRLSVTSTPGEGTIVSAQVTLAMLNSQKRMDAKRPAKAASRPGTLTDKQA